MIPLILHHRIVDPFEITLGACAEEWHQDMNARLVYDFILLIVLFIIPLTLMTYCYIRISFSLWFIDSSIQSPLAAMMNAARFSTISEDFPIEIRRNSAQNPRSLFVRYHKTNEQHGSRLALAESRSSLMQNRKRLSVVSTDNSAHRHSLDLMARRFSDNSKANTIIRQLNANQRSVSVCPRHSLTQYTSGIIRTSLSSLPTPGRCSIGNNQRRSVFDFEHASRFLQSRRRVVKLLITLGKADYLFVF